ncbi:PAS domain-containing protein [Falsiroseomonas sp. HC035]|uniref:PAS domain-containing protein n=1 Tax=Falsiroseomonas sp. HC035 TaxID=3390999 RepID=UPI003D32428E
MTTARRDGGAARLASPARWWLVAAVLAPLLVLGVSAWRAWEGAWKGAEAEVARTADAAAEYARRLLEAQVLRLERANDLLAGLDDATIRAREAEFSAALNDLAAERGPASEAGFYLFLFDRNAAPLVAGNLLPVPEPNPVLAQRDFNQALRGPDAPWVHVSQIYTGQATRRPYFAVTARRARTGNGLPPEAYDGIVNASVYLEQVNPSLAALAAPGDVVTLMRTDGTLLARSEGFPVAPDGARLNPGSPLRATMAEGTERAVLRATPRFDGAERLMALRRVGGDWPVYAASGRQRATIVAAWRAAVLPQAILAGSSALLLALLALAVQRRQRALVAANAALERRVEERTQDLRDRERLLRMAQQAASAASWSWEPASGRVRWSEEMYGLLGWNPALDGEIGDLESFLPQVHPEDREKLRLAAAAAIGEGSMSLTFRVFRRLPAGQREVVWLLCRARLYPAEGNEPAILVGIDIDITQQRRTEERFEVASAAMSGFVYEWDFTTGRVDRTSGVAALLGVAVPPDIEAWNARIHPEDLGRMLATMRQLEQDRAQEDYALEYRVRRADGGWAWLWDRGRVTRDDAGGLVRLMGGAVDVTARLLAEERQVLLLREVDHRAKNALAVVKAALRLTPRDEPEAFATAVEGRIDALARAQDLLSETSWAGTELCKVLEGALAPFNDGTGGPRVVLEGPALVLAASAIQPLAMAVHELATNATKYGALSWATGALHVAWQVRDGAMLLEWVETGGPPAEAPARHGFGSRVVNTTVRSQLGGDTVWHWPAEGLRLEILLPVARVLAADAGAVAGA